MRFQFLVVKLPEISTVLQIASQLPNRQGRCALWLDWDLMTKYGTYLQRRATTKCAPNHLESTCVAKNEYPK